jgi:hypothetical protein
MVGTIHNSIGLALTETGPLSAALEAFHHAAEIRERLVPEYPGNLRYQRNLLITNLRIGTLLSGIEFLGMGDAASGSVHIARVRSVAERLAQVDSNNALAKSDLVAAYARTGEVESYSQLGAAIDWFRRSIAIAQELVRGAPGSVHYRGQLATGSWRGGCAGPVGPEKRSSRLRPGSQARKTWSIWCACSRPGETSDGN